MKICILSEYANSLFADENVEAGGAEIQMTVLAKELAARSHDVSFVAFGKTNYPFEIKYGLKIYNPFNNEGSGYTYLYPQNVFKLLKTLNKIDADVYIQRATTPLTGFLALFAKLKNKKFIYSASSEMDVGNNLTINSINDLKKLFYKFGVKYSDVVVCQTNHQVDLLNQTLNKKGKLIKNLYPISRKVSNNGDSVLKAIWVGRIAKGKRPELFLKLAKNVPMLNFYMAGGCSDEDYEYYNKIKQSASKLKNVEFLGHVSHNKMDRYYGESALLVSTSSNEGFPNTFLEAWGNSIPVISLGFDPDGIISNHKLGLHSKTYEQMLEDFKTLTNNDKLRKEMGSNSREYVEKEHDAKKIVKEYERLIERLIGRET